jgi:hypothetical protein
MLFDEFTQVENTPSSEYAGTGLGLAISRKFCRLLRGDIELTSTRGAGSTFSVTPPAYYHADDVDDNANDSTKQKDIDYNNDMDNQSLRSAASWIAIGHYPPLNIFDIFRSQHLFYRSIGTPVNRCNSQFFNRLNMRLCWITFVAGPDNGDPVAAFPRPGQPWR